MHVAIRRLTPVIAVVVLPIALLQAVDKKFHNAPDSARAQKNPFEGQASAVEAGKRLYARNCLSCHGKTGQGKGNVPSLLNEKVEAATAGEVRLCHQYGISSLQTRRIDGSDSRWGRYDLGYRYNEPNPKTLFLSSKH